MEESKRRKGDDDTSSSMDRVSKLPEPILHHILSLLPQNQAAQTCLLSKSWCNVWRTRPNIEFQQAPIFRENLCIIEETLQRYHRQNLSIKRFVVNMSSRVDSESRKLLEKWIPIVLRNLGVETFHLTFPHSLNFHNNDVLPSAPAVFEAEFLTELYLCGFKVDDKQQQLPCLKHLKTLSLNEVYIEDDALAKIMGSCPLLERLDLCLCTGLTNLKINVPSALETIKITYCPSLCRLRLYNTNSQYHYFPRLKSLCLSHLQLPKDFFNSFSCNYPCLQDLELRSCSGLKQVHILSRSVRRLVIASMEHMIKTITIDTPHILYFGLSCRSFASPIPLPSVSFAASREWESNISLPFLLFTPNIDIFLDQLGGLLKALRQSQITLNLDGNKYYRIENFYYAGCYESLAVEHLNLRGFDSYDDDFGALFSLLFLVFHPRYIYTRRMHSNSQDMCCLHNNDKLAEFIWKTNLKDGEFSRCYFWPQVKELSVEIFDHDSRQWRRVQGSSLTVCALKEIQETKNIRFAFEWREQGVLKVKGQNFENDSKRSKES